jgi:ABC-type proline/glycine betaine transport system ATPase subunit
MHFAHSSADLDSEQRIVASRVIKRFIMHAKKTAFIVEHDFIMATYLADRVIVFDGQPGIDAHANKPESLLTGCNTFLKNLDVTFRRDPTNFRPRINKLNSQLDQEQKLSGNYVSAVTMLTWKYLRLTHPSVLLGGCREELLKRASTRATMMSTTAALFMTMHRIPAF